MLKAVALGTLAQSALLLSGLLVYWIHFPPRFVGVLAGFGAGALIEAVAFDLVAEAENLDSLQFAIWMLAGAAILLIGDRIVDRRFGVGGGGAMGIVVGSMVDGVPESAILGIQVATGYPITLSFFAAVFVPTSLRPSLPPPISRSNGGRSVGSRASGHRSWCSVASPRASATFSRIRSPVLSGIAWRLWRGVGCSRC
jgi:ZIP family zinc transporter